MAPGKRPRVTLSPTLVTRPDNTVIALSTPGGDNQDQALIQVLFYDIMFGANAEQRRGAAAVSERAPGFEFR